MIAESARSTNVLFWRLQSADRSRDRTAFRCRAGIVVYLPLAVRDTHNSGGNDMRLIAVSYGTEGDARPLAALCGALLDAGHDARLLADRGTLGVVVHHAKACGPKMGSLTQWQLSIG